jgi:hypothetical protein
MADESTLLSEVDYSWSYDAFGNVTFFTEHWGPGDHSSVVTDYHDDPPHIEDWLISLPIERYVHSTRGEQQGTRTQRFSYAPGEFTGLPEEVIDEPGTAQALTTHYAYNAFGNLTHVSKTGSTVDAIETRGASFQYDALQLFPIVQTDAKDHDVEVVYDVALGIPVQTTEEGLIGVPVTR